MPADPGTSRRPLKNDGRAIVNLRLGIGAATTIFSVIQNVLATFGATRVIATQLWGTSEHDPLTLAAVMTVVALVGLMACYVPARRATKVDPLVALRG